MHKKLLLLIALLSFSMAANAAGGDPMVLVVESYRTMKTAHLPLQGTVDAVIHWGDGAITNADSAQVYTHEYEEIGVDTIKIFGTVTHFGLYNGFRILIGVLSWGDIGLTDLSYAFYNISPAFIPDSLPEGVTDLSYMFYGSDDFNQDISNWDVSNVTSMKGMFWGAVRFTGDLSGWDVSNVTNMDHMFSNAGLFNGDLSGWDVSNVTDMNGMFNGASSFTGYSISDWDVSNVTDMSTMFSYTNVFNEDIGSWDVSNVTEMSSMFYYSSFEADISNWDVSNVTDMSGMFSYTTFNCDLNNWDVSNVTDMQQMFYNAVSFNGNIKNWDVSNVTNMTLMFSLAYRFDQDLGNWNVAKVTDMRSMFDWMVLSTENYSNILIGWSDLALQSDVKFSANMSKYNGDGASAREKIIETYGWSISDGGGESLLSFFTGEMKDSSVVFNWEMLTQVEDSGYTIERCTDTSVYSPTWEILDFVESNPSYTYNYTDDNPPLGSILLYRLGQIALNGSIVYLDTVAVDTSQATGIEIQNEDMPTGFNLAQNYPNPFNPTTSIEYRVSSSGNVSIKVYNMLGQEVMTLVNEMKSPGTYNVKMDGSRLASGVYIYRMTAGSFSSVKKLMLMK